MDISEGVITDYLARLRARKDVSPHTLNAYRFDLRDFSAFIKKAGGALDGPTILQYSADMMERRSAAPRTVKRRMACLRGFCRDLLRSGAIATWPFEDLAIELPKTRSLPRALGRDDAKKLAVSAWDICSRESALGAVAADCAAAVLVLLSVGLRVGELVALRTADFDPVEGGLRVRGKGRRDRRVFIVDERLKRLLADRCRSTTWFLGGVDGPWSTHSFRQRLRHFAADAGVRTRVTPHMLRHTAATLLLEDGVDLLFLQRLLGHEHISTTALYAHVGDASLRKALQRAGLLSSLAA